MSSQDLHQVILRWPHTDAYEVIVTGTFDQWSGSIRLTRKPDGFETPVLIPWKDKIAYKFIVDGRWVTNDAEPTEIDNGFVNNVYTAPPKPPSQEPQLPTPSYRSESEVEPEHAEKVPVDADKPVANGYALDEPHEVPTTPTAEPAPEKPSTLVEGVKADIAPAVGAAHVAVAQVAPGPQAVERASDELVSEPQAPEESVTTSVSSPAQSNAEQERSTAAVVVAQVEEQSSTPAPEPAEGTRDADVARVEGPEEVTSMPVENGASATEAEPPKDATLTVGEEAKVAAGPEPAPEPEPEPVTPVVEPVPEPAKVEAPTAAESVPAHEREGAPTVLEPSEPTPSLVPPPASEKEQESAPAKSTSSAPVPEPACATAPGPEVSDTNPSDAPSPPLPPAPAVNGHTKSTSTASTSTAVPSLPTTAIRKTSRKFSFPGRDKSGNSSPTGSSRFSSQQKREKRPSLLGKLKEIFGDKEKKEKEKSVKA